MRGTSSRIDTGDLMKSRMETVLCRPMQTEDLPQVLTLFRRIRPGIAGLCHESIYKVILQEALRNKEVTCFAALINKNVKGYILAIVNWNLFWRKFLLRHPFLGFRILLHRVSRVFTGLGKKPESFDPLAEGREKFVSEMPDHRSWKDSSSAIAKVVHIGVDHPFRSKGIGYALYGALKQYLCKQGVNRMDATIDEANVASVKMHRRMGWLIASRSGTIFASLDLQKGNQ